MASLFRRARPGRAFLPASLMREPSSPVPAAESQRRADAKAQREAKRDARAQRRRTRFIVLCACGALLVVLGGPAGIVKRLLQLFRWVGATNGLASAASAASQLLPKGLGWLWRGGGSGTVDGVSNGDGDSSLLVVPTLAAFNSVHFGAGATVGAGAADLLDCAPTNATQTGSRAPRDEVTLVLLATLADLGHASLLLASLGRWLDNSPGAGVREFVLVTPDADAVAWDSVLAAALPRGLSARVLRDSALLSGLAPAAGAGAGAGASARAPGYASQMLLKLLVARYVASEFYLVLDADVALAGLRHARRDLLGSGHGEGRRATFEPTYRNVHSGFWAASERLLSAPGCIGGAPETVVMGFTPAVLSRTLAAQAVCRLRAVHGDGDWLRALYSAFADAVRSQRAVGASERSGAQPVSQWMWTEYALYFVSSHCKSEVGAAFDDYHFTPPPGARRLLGLLSGAEEASFVATAEAFGEWRSFARNEAFAPEAERGHMFVVLQSRSGVPVSLIASALSSVLS
jgi:hypothetical protein